MDALDAKLCRTWFQVLVDSGHRDAAALLIDAEIFLDSNNWNNPYVLVDLPLSAYTIVSQDQNIQQVAAKSLAFVAKGHITDQNGNPLDEIPIEYRLRLLEAEEDWRAVVRSLIVSAKNPNQGLVTEKAFARRGASPLEYNEMKFASHSEIRIAQELERQKVLFFPLPLAVRCDTGTLYKDHREVDFLVCKDGVWGILEVSRHADRYEEDAAKGAWFKKSGILCVEHYTAERCYSESGKVVTEFLEILGKHRR